MFVKMHGITRFVYTVYLDHHVPDFPCHLSGKRMCVESMSLVLTPDSHAFNVFHFRLQQLGRTGRTDRGIHVTMMSHDQYLSQVRSSDVAQLEESDISPMILRSLVAGRAFARLPFLCPPHPRV